MTPRLISVQGFRFPRAADEPPRRLHLRGLLRSAFPAGVFALPSNQPLEATKQMKSTFTMHHKKIRTNFILSQESRFIVRIFLKLNYFFNNLVFVN